MSNVPDPTAPVDAAGLSAGPNVGPLYWDRADGTTEAADPADPADATAERDVMDRWPGLMAKPDAYLIDLIADPPPLMADADEAAAAAGVILTARLDGRLPQVA